MTIDAIKDNTEDEISISLDRYLELIKAEHDCSCLKKLIYEKAEDFGTLSYEELCVLKRLYFTNVEGSE